MTFFSTIRLLSVSSRQHSVILEIIHRMQAAYDLMYSLQRKDIQKGATVTRYFYFLCVQKVLSSLHTIQVEFPCRMDGLDGSGLN